MLAIAGSPPRKTEASVRFEPTIMGTLAEIAWTCRIERVIGEGWRADHRTELAGAADGSGDGGEDFVLRNRPEIREIGFWMLSALRSFSVRSMPMSGVSRRSCEPE